MVSEIDTKSDRLTLRTLNNEQLAAIKEIIGVNDIATIVAVSNSDNMTLFTPEEEPSTRRNSLLELHLLPGGVAASVVIELGPDGCIYRVEEKIIGGILKIIRTKLYCPLVL